MDYKLGNRYEVLDWPYNSAFNGSVCTYIGKDSDRFGKYHKFKLDEEVKIEEEISEFIYIEISRYNYHNPVLKPLTPYSELSNGFKI